MYAAAAAALMIWLASIYSDQAMQSLSIMRYYRAFGQQAQLVMLAENIQQYYNEKGVFPASLAALAATPGYEHTRSLLHNWQGYAVSGVLVDSVWKYQRAVVYSNDPTRGVDAAAYLAANTCGTGAFNVADSWCPVKSSAWKRWETREFHNDLLNSQLLRLNRTQQKMASYFNANGGFPTKDASNADLVATNTYTLASLAGYGGAASNCTGTYLWQGIPIDCGDMFDRWGGTVGFAFFTDKHFVLTSETPVTNASGNTINIGGEYSVQ